MAWQELASAPLQHSNDTQACPQVWEGDGVVKSARKLIGATNPLEAEPGTIRGDLAVQTGRNVVHGSDSPENGERETGACAAPLHCAPVVVLQGCLHAA